MVTSHGHIVYTVEERKTWENLRTLLKFLIGPHDDDMEQFLEREGAIQLDGITKNSARESQNK